MKKIELVLQRIMQEREKQHIEVEEMAVQLNVDKRTYYRYENGETPITLEKFMKIAVILNRDIIYFFRNTTENHHYEKNDIVLTQNCNGTLIFQPSEKQIYQISNLYRKKDS